MRAGESDDDGDVVRDDAASTSEAAVARWSGAGPTIVCTGEPPNGAIVAGMRRAAARLPQARWVWCPEAHPFDLVAVNDDGRPKSVRRHVDYASLDAVLLEAAVYALAANAVRDARHLARVPVPSFVLVVDPTSEDDARRLARWRCLQEAQLLFTCVAREWNARLFPTPGVYRWRGPPA